MRRRCEGPAGLYKFIFTHTLSEVISLRQIAKKAGVSPAAVSFALNGRHQEMRISTKLTEKIKRIAKKEGYHPNQAAVALRTGKSKIIGLIVDTISGSFFAELASIIESEVEKFGFKVIYCSTGNQMKKGKDLIRMLYQHQLDGYLIIPTEGMNKDIQLLMERKKPLVLMDSYFSGTKAPYVMVNNAIGASMGMKYLVDKGYKKIAFVCNDLKLIQMKDRVKGYKKTLEENKIKVEEKLICITRFSDSKEKITEQISQLIKTAKPDAIMFAANYLGVCGLDSIRSLGLKIPNDIAVVCFDDHELFRFYNPAITSVQQPVEEIAKTAVNMLMAQLGVINNVSLKHAQLQPRLIERSSA